MYFELASFLVTLNYRTAEYGPNISPREIILVTVSPPTEKDSATIVVSNIVKDRSKLTRGALSLAMARSSLSKILIRSVAHQPRTPLLPRRARSKGQFSDIVSDIIGALLRGSLEKQSRTQLLIEREGTASALPRLRNRCVIDHF